MPQKTLSSELTFLLDYAIEHKASDLHIVADASPTVRIDGHLVPVDRPTYTASRANEVVGGLIGDDLLERITTTRKELDFSFSYEGLRFRSNVFYQKGVLAASLRVLPSDVPQL